MTRVTLKENDPPASPGKYLTGPLEVFTTFDLEQNEVDQIENMAAIHNEHNIRAKIQEYERQLNTNDISVPTPRPRNGRPAVAPKPSMIQRASASRTTEEETNTQSWSDKDYEEVLNTDVTPAPVPLAPRKPSLNSSDWFKFQPLINPPPQLPSRSSLRRTRTLNSQDNDAVFNTPPFSPHMGQNSQQNVDHHCSTKENVYVDFPVSKSHFHPVLQKKERKKE